MAHIAIVKFKRMLGVPGREYSATLWKAELVSTAGDRLGIDFNRGYQFSQEEYARHAAAPYAKVTGWPVILEDQTTSEAKQ